MEITKEQLIEAGNDLSKVCELEPPFETIEESFSNEDEFLENLKSEITQFIEFQDPETNLYDFQAGDVVLIQESTKEIIKTLSPITENRLKEVFGVNEAIPEPEKKEIKNSTKNKKTKSYKRAEFLYGLFENPISKKEISKKLKEDFGDSDSESKFQTNIALCYLEVFGSIKEENNLYSLI